MNGFRPLTGFMVLNQEIKRRHHEAVHSQFPSPYGVYGS